MQNEANWIKGVAAALGGLAAYLWGPWDALVAVLVSCVAIDYITGVIKAGYKHELSSKVGFWGLLKKLFIFGLIALATQLDKVVPSANGAIRAAVMLFYIANEGLSILENAGEMGLPIPKILRAAIASIKKSSGEDESEIEQEKQNENSANDAEG